MRRTNVRKGSTAVHPVSCGNRLQWVGSRPWAASAAIDAVAPKRYYAASKASGCCTDSLTRQSRLSRTRPLSDAGALPARPSRLPLRASHLAQRVRRVMGRHLQEPQEERVAAMFAIASLIDHQGGIACRMRKEDQARNLRPAGRG